MKGFKQYISHIVILCLVACGLFFMLPTDITVHEVDQNEGWEIYYEGKYHEMNGMLKYINNSSEISFRKKVDSIGANQVLAFQTIQSEVYIYSDNHLIYTFKSPIDISKTPGNKVHQIELPESEEEHQIEVVIKPVYDDSKFTIPTFTIGHMASVGRSYISESILPFALSAILFVLGIVVSGAWAVISRAVNIDDDLLWLGLFAVMISTWLMLETQLISQVFGNYLFWSWMTILSLKAAVNPISKFVEILYSEDQKLFYWLRMASSTDIFMSIILQLLGIVDLCETLIVTHCIFAIGVVIGVYAGIKSVKLTSSKKKLRTVHSYGLVILGVLVGMDVICYYIMPSVDAARFTRIGLLLYTCVFGSYVLLDTITLLKAEERADLLSELAWMDAMTKLANRNAYERDIDSFKKDELIGKSVVIFDLNNLKYVNDTYGHRMGDYYITIASEFIKETFEMFGTVYRIGGDEFCAIVDSITEDKLNELRKILNERLESLHGNHFEGKMEVAVGFAEFDEELDENLASTVHRADENMYTNKEFLKTH